VTNVVRQFIEQLQRTTEPPADERKSYLKLESTPTTWERTRWIDGERLEQDLVGVLERAWVEDSPDRASDVVLEAVVRRNASFVALVEDDRRFVGLLDRSAVMGQLLRNRDTKKADTAQAAS
jgi:hypothetical protein